jgi:hypothetical protein
MQAIGSSLFFHTPSLSHWHFEFGMSSLLRLFLVPHCLMPYFGKRLQAIGLKYDSSNE